MRRMIAFVAGQRLPNFIPLNEPSTRPDALHLVYTPGDRAMQRSLDELTPVIRNRFPKLILEEPVRLEDPYNGQEIRGLCERLLDQHPGDEWLLNATGGTKLMYAPVMDLFMRRDLPIVYVETPNRRMVQVRKDWSSLRLPFEGAIDLETYSALHGATVANRPPVTRQELALLRALQALDWRVWSSVTLFRDGVLLHEYDVVGIAGYQLAVFECKRLSRDGGGTVADVRRRQHSDVREDLLKLFQVRQQFGGPFGRSYWCLSGNYRLSAEELQRIVDFGVCLILGREIQAIRSAPARFDLPCGRAETRPRDAQHTEKEAGSP